MKTITKTVHIDTGYPIHSLIELDKSIFFDIETTSLSAQYGEIYLISFITHVINTEFLLTQLFSEGMKDEKLIIDKFYQTLSHYQYIVHFNGDSFDIPFVKKAANQYGLVSVWGNIKSIDIYSAIRKYRKLFKLDNLRQKTVERYLGIHRQDRFSGGELIPIYKSYLAVEDEGNLSCLLLHNEEDVIGLVKILPILSICHAFSDEHRELSPLLKQLPGKLNKKATFIGLKQSEKDICLDYSLALPVIKPISIKFSHISLRLDQSKARLNVQTYKGMAKYFFEDYKNYYYLPYEDTAVHKSIGNFVDRTSRKKATKKTAYIKNNSLYMYVYGAVFDKIFYKEYMGKDRMIALKTFLEKDALYYEDYLDTVYKYLGLY